MKLWLDDIRTPPEAIEYDMQGALMNPSTGWVWCKTVEEAERLIIEGVVTELSFDHDLGETPASRPDNVQLERTGYELACYIEELAVLGVLKRIKWSIHSANPVGRAKIYSAMATADRFWSQPRND